MAGRGRKRYHRGRRKKGNWFTRMQVWQRVLLIVAGVLVVTLGSAAGYVAAKWNKVDTQEIKTEDIVINEEVKKNVDLGDGYTNFALFGVDSREGDLGEGTRSDCIIVASLNNATKEIRMVSVYRDTVLNLSEGTYQKCNAAYSFGGPTMAINMLNMNLDLDIEDYATVDFGAISDAIDLLGGLDIEVTDEEAAEMNNHIEGTALEAGKEYTYMDGGGLLHLDGVQATTYARVRSTAGGDFTRTERQRLVIQKMFEKAKQADLATLNKIVDAVFPKISTSLSLTEILKYVTAYQEFTLGENTGFPYEDALGMDTLSGLGSVVYPSDLVSNVKRVHEFLFGTTDYEPSATVQEISNQIAYKVSNSRGTTDTGDTANTSQDYSATPETGNTYNSGTGTGTTNGGTGGGTVDNGTGDDGTGGSTDNGTDGGTDSGSGDGTGDTGETTPGAGM